MSIFKKKRTFQDIRTREEILEQITILDSQMRTYENDPNNQMMFAYIKGWSLALKWVLKDRV
jgi:hypothetical protein